MQDSPEFKQAAIDWLLAHGTCESMTQTTRDALAHLAVYGVDYEASDLPDFTTVAVDPGDTFHDATYGEAFAATVYSRDPRWVGQETWRRNDGYEFWVGKTDLQRLMLSQMIMGVIAAAESGDAAWKAKANPREVERFERQIAAEDLLAPREGQE